MTSYMYNPSKKVTELLSQYLEFDPEQLKIGIWSGNLSLRDVHLRQEAIYPLLNMHHHKAQQQQAQSPSDVTAAAAATNDAAAASASADAEAHFGKAQPPLRFKLVSGTIGELTLKIPWKRLVWGQGDVQVNLKNIMIVIALESREETAQRAAAAAAAAGSAPNENPASADTDLDSDDDDDDAAVAAGHAPLHSPTPVFLRERKSKVLREAERRHLQGRNVTAYLEKMRKRNEEALQKELLKQMDQELVKKEGTLEKWLRGATGDFFWRFYAGLQMTVENFKVVIIQDGIEVGFIMPLQHVMAGKTMDRRLSSFGGATAAAAAASLHAGYPLYNNPTATSSSINGGVGGGGDVYSASASGHPSGVGGATQPSAAPGTPNAASGGGGGVIAGVMNFMHGAAAAAAMAAEEATNAAAGVGGGGPPQDVVYEGAYEDGEHVDKKMKFVGFGIYLRKLPTLKHHGGGAASAPWDYYNQHRPTLPPTLSSPTANSGGGGGNAAMATSAAAVLPDVTMREYLVRPVDLDFNFSLFFPYPPEKRKKKEKPPPTSTAGIITGRPGSTASASSPHHHASGATNAASVAGVSLPSLDTQESNASSNRQRRGKRDKVQKTPEAPAVTATTDPDGNAMLEDAVAAALASLGGGESTTVKTEDLSSTVAPESTTTVTTPAATEPKIAPISAKSNPVKLRQARRMSAIQSAGASFGGLAAASTPVSLRSAPVAAAADATSTVVPLAARALGGRSESMDDEIPLSRRQTPARTPSGGSSSNSSTFSGSRRNLLEAMPETDVATHGLGGSFASLGLGSLESMPEDGELAPDEKALTSALTASFATTGAVVAVSEEQPKQLNQPRHQRRQSIAAPLRGTSAVATVTPKKKRHGPERNLSMVPLARPLARPQDIDNAYATALADPDSAAARLDAVLRVGAIQVVCSTRQYQLLSVFLAAGKRMRNGRPMKTIKSVLSHGSNMRQSLTVRTESADTGNTETTYATPVWTEVVDDSSDGNPLKSAGGGGGETRLRLELRSTRCERREVIRAWWHYAYAVVVWELRQRSKLRKNFQKRYLSFSWERQRYKRKRYVNLYLSHHLSNSADNRSSRGKKSPSEELRMIEYELPVEQILLYRSIARDLHVRGVTEMPKYIAAMRAHGGETEETRVGKKKRDSTRSSDNSMMISSVGEDNPFGGGTLTTVLGDIEKRCMTTRDRRDTGHGVLLPPCELHVPFAMMVRHTNAFDEATMGGMTLDTRTTRGGKSTRSRVSMMSEDSKQSEVRNPLNLFLTATMEKLEFMVVEEDNLMQGYAGPHHNSPPSSDSDSSEPTSVSGLTDEDPWDSDGSLKCDDESTTDPIMASTDFLLFKLPEKNLLRVVITTLSFSARGQTGGSRNVSCRICQVEATSDDGRSLLSIGSVSDVISLSDHALSRDRFDDDGPVSAPADAFSLSAVIQKDAKMVQCDASTVKVTADLKTANQLAAFLKSGAASFPQPVLEKSAREEIRLYVLRQNTATALSLIDASVRFHGFQLLFPGAKEPQKKTSERERPYPVDPLVEFEADAILRTDLVEFYSGMAVEDLGNPSWQPSASAGSARLGTLTEDDDASKHRTRKLNMLDVAELLEGRNTVLSYNWVVASTGLDFSVTSPKFRGEVDAHRSFFENPIDIEVFGTLNSDSVFDLNRAKEEYIIEVSPVHMIMSETRLRLLSKVIPTETLLSNSKLPTACDEPIPPRLEVLSRFLVSATDLTVRRARVSLVTDDRGRVGTSCLSKHAQLDDFLLDFLRVVKGFDLSWPHEEALSSAMQICIDRLTGIGFQLDHAWECANTALLNFLEDMAEAQSAGEGGQHSLMEGGSEKWGNESTIRNSVSRTIDLFSDRMPEEGEESQIQNHLVFDLPDGVSASIVRLFYDSHVAILVPSMFVTNGDGIHILRFTPELQPPEPTDEEELDARSDAVATLSNGGVMLPSSVQHAAAYRQFEVDRQFQFGKGGLPLSVLGEDLDITEERDREWLGDVEIGDVELLFCQEVFEDILQTCVDIFGALNGCLRQVGAPVGEEAQSNSSSNKEDITTSFLAASTSISALLTTDELVPFSRLTLNEFIAKSGKSKGSTYKDTSMSSKSLSLLNLAPAGELHPEPLSVPPSILGLPFFASYSVVDGDTLLRIELRGLRVYILKQYINECRQYMMCERYGFGLFSCRLKEVLEQLQMKSEKKRSVLYEIHMFDCSLLLPRSMTSSDLLAVELDEGILISCHPDESFEVPTKSTPLRLRRPKSAVSEENKSGQQVKEGKASEINRFFVQLKKFRMFTSMADNSDDGDKVEDDGPAFGFFFGIDGRAEANKVVYQRYASVDNQLIDDAFWAESEKAKRVWQEVTTDAAALEIVADYTPHLRLLICDPADGDARCLGLDLKLPQFCLLLSCWYANMQELPVMFPYTVEQLEIGARLPAPLSPFPEYGTKQWCTLLTDPDDLTSEIAVCLSGISLRCSLDGHGSTAETGALVLAFDGIAAHITNDAVGLTRIGIGSLAARLLDESKSFDRVIESDCHRSPREFSWADTRFGIYEDCRTLSGDLQQSFQFTIFMSPDWSLYNLGMDSAHLAMADFTSIFRLLEFFTLYFADLSLGHPSFTAEESADMMKSELGKDENTTGEAPGSMLDFRLWLTRPLLRIPCDALDRTKPSLRMDVREGLWYRYTSADEFSSMECVAKSLWLIYDHKSDEAYQGSTGSGRPLIEGLTFGLRLDYNGDSEHQDISLVIPFVDENACQLTSPRICTQPTVLERPTICSPYEQPHRFLGPNICEMTCIVEVLPLAWATLQNLFTGGADEALDGDESEVDTTDRDSQAGSLTTATEDTIDVESTISFVGCIGDIRIFALDPVLGPHLPVAVASIASVNITASRFSDGKDDLVVPRGEAPPEDLQVLVEGHLWADYFKLGLTRSWEPLVEAYKFSLFYEKSRYRGIGLSLNSDVPLHLNISGALLMILDEVLDAFRQLIQKTFGAAVEDVESDFRATLTRSTNRDRILVNDVLDGVDLVHELSRTLNCEDRVAFALKNMTGQMIRAHRLEAASVDSEHSSAVTLSYLENLKSTKLSFQPSISIIKNLQVVEVEYPGLENSPRRTERDAQGSVHEVHVQLPGFRWLRGIKVDNFGRHFVSLVPRSKDLTTTARHDWRIANVMKLLVEVGLENGGRVVTLRSLFSVVNRTTHVMHIRLHPDPTDDPGEMAEPDTELDPGEQYQVPTLLLESAMRQPGSHLGSFWLRPAGDAVLETFLGDSVDSGDMSVNFSSKPVQLAKAVSQSAQIFEASRGEDVPPDLAKSGVQVSCPVMKASGERDVAPFCYALEIERSPLVRARLDTEYQKKQSMVHGPVSYTLSVHAPFVVVNLLPERGRFELMHAVRRTVLWFADLEPGQQVSVHSVGLDAPLFLLINLGFCRTPVGEGALVHHGVDPPPGIRENLGGLMSIGKAGKAMTKQLGKTLTSLGESPDKRGHQLLFLANHPQLNTLLGDQKPKGQRLPTKGASDLGLGMGDDEVGGKTYRVDTTTFFPSDCAAETTVVDGVGQRLTLNIENIRGGGGQRRISVFCPFWIINTTEHALRYKQDKSKNFVSGTVMSPEENGSLPLSGGRSGANNRDERDENASLSTRRPLTKGTIFGGTPGALATSAGRCHLEREQLAPLLDKNLSLQTLASLAFMFNFQEGVLSIGNQKLCVQLGDGTGTLRYQSDWSRGFSLDSVGFSQVVLMNCKDLRALEIVVVTQTAPGYLSGYTKIVRFLPRYVVVNNLPYGVRLWQHNSIFRPASSESTSPGTAAESGSKLWRFHGPQRPGKIRVNQYEVLWGHEAVICNDEDVDKMPAGTTAHHSAHYVATVLPSTWRPFNLPDSRGDRLLRIDLGGLWNLTASISADVPGEHTLRITRAIDLRLFKHVSTRASPHYDVNLPPSGESVFAGELGIWFETEWGTDRSLIVKDLKKDSFCFNKTDVHVGDELLLIDGAPVSRMTFAEAMNVLRNRLGELRMKAQQQAQQSEPPPRRPMRRGSLGFAISNRFAGSKPALDEGSGPVRPLRLTFRTVEERLRRVRLKAAKSSAAAVRPNPPSDGTPATPSDAQYDGTLSRSTEPTFMKAELRTLHHSLFLVLGQDPAVPYQIQNRSSSSTIYFRQRGSNGHPWRSLKPGASELYAWEEPMKPRRLSLRIATDSAFSFANDADADDFGNSSSVPSIRSGEKADVENKVKPSVGKSLFRKVKDEEDAVFSPSVSVRLEEIGFREFLSCGRPSDGFQGEQRHLQLEVDVVSSTRVLVVHDVSSEDGVEQMIRHLESLRNKHTEEERRNNELRAMKSVLSVSTLSSSRAAAPNDSSEVEAAAAHESPEEAIIEAATDLMLDFPEETTISRKHKIVVEVIEAIGLSPDDFVGTCNPYVELHLKSRTAGKSLFSEQDLRRTYYVRKSINPTWNSQSFVFNVPPNAVSVTRGHAIKLKVRNYRRIGNHNVLGRAQVDLHSVRNQEPLLGWFPLAGRTGRRELENSLSHWGRGSIKLRVQWIYSTPALFDYFIMLSDARLLDLQESTVGMANQLEKKKEDDQKKREGMDGFKAVRVSDMLPTRRQSIQQKRFQVPKVDDVMKIIEPIRPGFRKNRHLDHDFSEFDESESTLGSTRAGPSHLGGDAEMKKKLAIAQKTTPASLHDLEDRITMQRQSFQSLASNRHKPGKRLSCVVQANHGGKLELASFVSWTAAQRLFNHKDLEIQVRRGDIVAALKPKSHAAPDPDESLSGSRRILARKLHLPASIPKTMALAAREYASSFVESRSSLERSARRSLRAALNPGGWLTVRPVQALNLPDTYNGMFVKLRYGAETLLSETVDSTVYPTWIKKHPQPGDSGEHDVPAESLEFFPNDLHIYVAPQKTSGSIRLSVVGEGRHQSLTTRTELGVLHIPLGAAIAACIDCIEEFLDSESEESSSSPVYVRWFPLMNSKDTVPVEGDRGLGWRPRESEKIGDDLFKEYFAPCIQLALIWSPDVEKSDANDDDEEAIGGPRLGPALSSHHPSLVALSGGATRMVENYFNADIGQISVALIDSQRAFELAACALSDIDIRYWVTKAKTRFGLAVGWFQLDQQDDAAREPVMIAPTPHDFVSAVVQILAVKDNLRSKTDVLSFEFIDVSIAEFDLTMEESFLFDLFDFFTSLRLRRGIGLHSSKAQGTGVDIIAVGQGQSLLDLDNPVDERNEPTLYSILTSEGRDTKGETRVYIEQLFLGVVKFNLSYLKGKKEGWKPSGTGWTEMGAEDAAKVAIKATGETLIRTFSYYHEKSDVFTGWSQHTSREDRASEGRGSYNLPTMVASLFPNVSDAPVRLQGKALNHVFESPREIVQSIKKYYVNETLGQIYKIIGSLDFVGNPTMVLTSFMSGVRDLVVQPSMAFTNSPGDLSRVGIGVAKGTLSLFSHSFSGFFGFLAKISAAAGQGLATLSLDKDYRSWHRDQIVTEATNLNRTWKRRGVQSAQQMVTRPIGDILLGVGSGISGIVFSPYKGYQRGGHIGLINGVAVGIVGVVVRPVVGVLDAFSHFTATIHDVAKSVNVLEKRFQPAIKYRLPYVFGTKHVLTPFDDTTARAVYFLKKFPPTKARRAASQITEIVVHVELLPNIGTDTLAILTNVRLILIRVKKEPSGALSPTVCWEVAVIGGATVSSRIEEHGHNGVALTITVKTSVNQEAAEAAARLDGNTDTGGDIEEGSVQPEGGLGMEGLERADEFEFGTGRSKEGELLEWFTVVAEYQYRRQLARLHNALSCAVGDFDSVLWDKFLGRPGSAEGFTRFGIFSFEPQSAELERFETSVDPFERSLEHAPWMSEGAFGEIGPDWLVTARAEGAYLNSNQLESSSSSYFSEDGNQGAASTMENNRGVRKFARWLTSRLPTIPDKDMDEEEEVVTTPTRRTPDSGQPPAALKRGDSFDSEDSAFKSADSSDVTPDEKSSFTAMSQRQKGRLSVNSSLYQSSRSHMSDEDLADSPSSSPVRRNPQPRSPEGLDMTPTRHPAAAASAATRPRPELDRALSAPALLQPTDSFDRILNMPSIQDGRAPFSPSRRDGRPPMDIAQAQRDVEGGWATEYEVRTKYKMHRQQHHHQQVSRDLPSRSSQRLERMEALMERLLIFSTEQSMQQNAASPPRRRDAGTRSDADSLWWEVRGLRAQLRQQQQEGQHLHSHNPPPGQQDRERFAFSNAQDEIATLRGEIEALRHRIESGATSTQASSQNQSSDDDHSERFEV